MKSLEYIKNYNESTIVGLLKFLDPEDDAERRIAAQSKIVSFSHWEEDLIVVLTTKDPTELK